jgi:hypothetical protein
VGLVGQAKVDRGVEGGVHVRPLDIEGAEPRGLVGAPQVRVGALGEREVPGEMPATHGVALPRLDQPGGGVGADRLEQAVPRPRRPVVGHHERALDEPAEHVGDLGGVADRGGSAAGGRGIGSVRTDGRGGRQRAPVGVDGQAPQHDPLVLVQQVPAPVEHRLEGAVTLGPAAPTGPQQPEAVAEAAHHL